MERVRLCAVLMAAVIGFSWLGCASILPREVTHVVKKGETVYWIARYYGVSTQIVIRVNKIENVRAIQPGSRLRIVGARRAAAKKPILGTKSDRLANNQRAAMRHAKARGLDFLWPTKGTLTSRFGPRWGRSHEGIDIGAPQGTKIRASERGRIIYSGSGLGAYGNIVIIRHRGDYETVYAHNLRNHVRKGDTVKRGKVIAEVGKTGRATGPHLHFEIRFQDKARDPLLYFR